MATFKCGDKDYEAFRVGHDPEPGWFGRLVSLHDARPFDGGWELFTAEGVRDIASAGDWIVATDNGKGFGHATESLTVWTDGQFRADFLPT